jgi:hypothetical protein
MSNVGDDGQVSENSDSGAKLRRETWVNKVLRAPGSPELVGEIERVLRIAADLTRRGEEEDGATTQEPAQRIVPTSEAQQ